MNRQDIYKDGKLVKKGIGWTQPWGLPGYTANPVKGCLHECEWLIDGQWAKCYAGDVARGIAKASYPHGFEHLSFHPDELRAIERTTSPCGIFIDSMSDLFGAKVEQAWIQEVMNTIVKCPHITFMSLTKNSAGLRKWQLPKNLWVGISTPPSRMYGKDLRLEQQHAFFRKAIEDLALCTAEVKWISMEPLSIDICDDLEDYEQAFNWAVIGAASRGSTFYQPETTILQRTVELLDNFKIPIYFKENILPALAESVAGRFRADFPAKPKTLQPGELFGT
jgi:protein gp37